MINFPTQNILSLALINWLIQNKASPIENKK